MNREPAQSVGQVFFPLDEELSLQPGSLTPKQQEHLAHLSVWMPFERAAQMLEKLLRVQVSEPTVRRATERAGALYEARQTAQSKPVANPSPAVIPCEKQVISTDGASLLCFSCFCVFVLLPPNPLRVHHVLLNPPLPCLVPPVLLPIIAFQRGPACPPKEVAKR